MHTWQLNWLFLHKECQNDSLEPVLTLQILQWVCSWSQIIAGSSIAVKSLLAFSLYRSPCYTNELFLDEAPDSALISEAPERYFACPGCYIHTVVLKLAFIFCEGTALPSLHWDFRFVDVLSVSSVVWALLKICTLINSPQAVSCIASLHGEEVVLILASSFLSWVSQSLPKTS